MRDKIFRLVKELVVRAIEEKDFGRMAVAEAYTDCARRILDLLDEKDKEWFRTLEGDYYAVMFSPVMLWCRISQHIDRIKHTQFYNTHIGQSD